MNGTSEMLPITINHPTSNRGATWLELGVYAGPAKVSVLLAHMPGPDRRHGVLIDRQPYIQAIEESGFQVFYPYNILMGKYYRAGVNSYRDMSASNVAGITFQLHGGKQPRYYLFRHGGQAVIRRIWLGLRDA